MVLVNPVFFRLQTATIAHQLPQLMTVWLLHSRPMTELLPHSLDLSLPLVRHMAVHCT